MFIPTYVLRPEILSIDTLSNLIKTLYANDNIYNAAPSGHTFYTLLTSLFLTQIFPKQKVIIWILSLLVIVSTVLTKQHNILDVVLGIVFGLMIYQISGLVLKNK